MSAKEQGATLRERADAIVSSTGNLTYDVFVKDPAPQDNGESLFMPSSN